jgi:hypothetical protein
LHELLCNCLQQHQHADLNGGSICRSNAYQLIFIANESCGSAGRRGLGIMKET